MTLCSPGAQPGAHFPDAVWCLAGFGNCSSQVGDVQSFLSCVQERASVLTCPISVQQRVQFPEVLGLPLSLSTARALCFEKAHTSFVGASSSIMPNGAHAAVS